MNTGRDLSTFWDKSSDDLIKTLDTSPQVLTSSDALRRLERYGPNIIKAKSKSSALGLFISQFKSPIVLILLFATALSAVLKDWVDAVIILLIILGSAVLSFLQEFNAGNAAEKLRAQITLKADVLREAQIQRIPAEQIVPGDIVLLSAGSLVPADGVILEAKDFFVNQAVLTGETYPVEKNPGSAQPVQVWQSVRTWSSWARMYVAAAPIFWSLKPAHARLLDRSPPG